MCLHDVDCPRLHDVDCPSLHDVDRLSLIDISRWSKRLEIRKFVWKFGVKYL